MRGIMGWAVAILCFQCLAACSGPARFSGAPGVQPLRRTVPESFHYKLWDPEAGRYLAALNPDAFPEDERLEILILRGLSQVPAESQLPRLFDQLWEEDGIRKLLQHPRRGSGYLYPLVELYYLLSAAPMQSWQHGAAERLFTEVLSDAAPYELSGYALHFYTLALLNNRKFASASPFLRRLEHFKTRSDYLRDLTVALAYASAEGEDRFACQTLIALCTCWQRSGLPFPDEEVKEAVLSLKRAGKLEEVRRAIYPLIRKNPRLVQYSFVEILNEGPPSPPTRPQSGQG